MDTGFLHTAAKTLQEWLGRRPEGDTEIPVRYREEGDEPVGGAPVEPLLPDQTESIAQALDQRLEAIAQGTLYAHKGEPPEAVGNALNMDAGLILVALDETLYSDEQGVEHLREILERWEELRNESLPEEDLENFLDVAEEYRRAWREYPGSEPFPFLMALGATDAFMLAEDEGPHPDEVARVAHSLADDAAHFYGEMVRLLAGR